MPIPVTEIEHSQMPLDQKILVFLSRSPGMAFTLKEIMEGLGDETPYLMAQAENGGQFLLGLLVDAGLEPLRDDVRVTYARALVLLSMQGQVRAYDYLGVRHYTTAQQALTGG